MTQRAYLELDGLTVGYGGAPVVSDITLKLRKGGIMCLIGPNGSGKSTILKTIARRIPPVSGRVLLDGADMARTSSKLLAEKMASVLTDYVTPELETCFDIVSAGRYPYTGSFGLLTVRDKAVVNASLQMVNASSIADRDFASVSDGQRQRVLLARAMAQEPELVVLDEPTSFLDIKHKIELLEILRDMAKERGVTVVMSLHELDLASKVSDVIACVSSGRISAWGAPEEIFSDEGVSRLYGLERGHFNAALGSVEMPKPQGEPRVFVVGGAGYGIPVYRGLQKAGIPFWAGILFDNDVEYAVARALAARVISREAFLPVNKEALALARAAVDACEAVIDSGCPTVGENRVNGDLLEYALSRGKPVLSGLEGFWEASK